MQRSDSRSAIRLVDLDFHGWLKMEKFWRLNRTGNHSASHSHKNKVKRNHPSKIPTSMETNMEASNLLVSWFNTDLRDLQLT